MQQAEDLQLDEILHARLKTLDYCTHCRKQGVRSKVAWKARLAYISHIRKKIHSCRIVSHFINEFKEPSLNDLRFILVDSVSRSKNPNETLLLQKERFFIGTLVIQHKGLNGKQDCNRNHRCDRER